MYYTDVSLYRQAVYVRLYMMRDRERAQFHEIREETRKWKEKYRENYRENQRILYINAFLY